MVERIRSPITIRGAFDAQIEVIYQASEKLLVGSHFTLALHNGDRLSLCRLVKVKWKQTISGREFEDSPCLSSRETAMCTFQPKEPFTIDCGKFSKDSVMFRDPESQLPRMLGVITTEADVLDCESARKLHNIARIQSENEAAVNKMKQMLSDREQMRKQVLRSKMNLVQTQLDHLKKPKIAIIGRRGVGKSSMCNALAGRTVANTSVQGSSSATRISKVYGDHPSEPFELWDLQHYGGTSKLQQQLESKHVIVIMYTDDIQNAIGMTKAAVSINVPVIAVRNKVDLIGADDAEKEGLHLDDLRSKTWCAEKEELDMLVENGACLIFTALKGRIRGLDAVKDCLEEILKAQLFSRN